MTTVIGTINTLELARRSKAKVIFSSNSGIYNTSKLPINEETPDNPKTPYDLDKLQSEKYLKLYLNYLLNKKTFNRKEYGPIR